MTLCYVHAQAPKLLPTRKYLQDRVSLTSSQREAGCAWGRPGRRQMVRQLTVKIWTYVHASASKMLKFWTLKFTMKCAQDKV